MRFHVFRMVAVFLVVCELWVWVGFNGVSGIILDAWCLLPIQMHYLSKLLTG